MMDRARSRTPAALVVILMVALAPVIAGDIQDGERVKEHEPICVPMTDNESRISNLLDRIEAYYRAIEKKDEDAIRQFYYGIPGEPGPTSGDRKAIRKLLANLQLEEWSIQRIQQCGPIARVSTSERYRVKEGGEDSSLESENAQHFWYEGDSWYIGGPRIREYVGNRDMNWDEDSHRAWLTDPYEPFLEVWVAPGQVPLGPEDRRRETGLTPIEPPSRPEDHSLPEIPWPERETGLRAAVCRYLLAAGTGDEVAVAEFWMRGRKEDLESGDGVYKRIKASGMEAIRSIKLDRIQLLREMGLAEVSASLYGWRSSDDDRRRAERVRVTGFWLFTKKRWLRVPAPASGWRSEDTEDLHVTDCSGTGFRDVQISPGGGAPGGL